MVPGDDLQRGRAAAIDRKRPGPLAGLGLRENPRRHRIPRVDFLAGQSHQYRPALPGRGALRRRHLADDRPACPDRFPLAMDIVLRAVIIYLLVFVFTRALGRRELATLQPFDLILLVVIGDLIQSGVTQNDLSITGVLLVVCTIGALQVGISYLGFRFRRMRPFLQGEPIVLVENGQLIDRNMRRERLTLDDLAEKARMSEIASIDEIKWAVLETNGDISFIKKPGS